MGRPPQRRERVLKMASKKDSIYHSEFPLTGDATITLTGEERTMINEALARCAPKEVDIMPILMCMDKIAKGGNQNG